MVGLPSTQLRFQVEQVPFHLQAGDLGFILRKNDHVNWVASPTKIPEYLRCGLALVATRGIGQTDTLIEKHHCGWLIDEISNNNSISQVIDSISPTDQDIYSEKMRQQRSNLAASFFGWNEHIGKIINRYEHLSRYS